MSRLLVANWKMNLGPAQAKAFVSAFAPLVKSASKTDVWLAPPFLSIHAAVQALEPQSSILIGAQNVHWDKEGAFTGEVSVQMLKDIGCQFAIVGHSERRHVFGETKQQAAQRALYGLSQGLKIIFCIGETLQERQAGQTNNILKSQLEPLLEGLSSGLDKDLVIAYEPVWAIGTGVPASIKEIEDSHVNIHEIWRGMQKAKVPRVLYGGSVTPENARQILESSVVSGALVGKASLSAETFSTLVKLAESL